MTKKYLIILGIIFLIGFNIRLKNLSSFPVGINQDEAYSGYEAYSIMNYKIDSHGYKNPIYFTTWGSGMNVLYGYFSIPAIKIFGLNEFSIRVTQSIFACAALVFFYLICSKIFDKRMSLIALFIFAINPWHIMLSRWGLESNFLIFFNLLGLFFFLKALDNPKFFIPSFISYGLGLYCYAPVWIITPIIILLQLIYCIYTKKINLFDENKKLSINKYLIISVVILFFIAVPLFLFLMVNNNMIDEIKTSFISIPKIMMRDGEYSIKNITGNITEFLKMIMSKKDLEYYNALPNYKLYYIFSFPFIAFGFISLIFDCIHFLKLKKIFPPVFILIWFLSCLPSILLLDNANVNRLNSVHLPMIFFLCYFFRSIYKNKKLLMTFIFIYFLSFVMFSYDYFNEPVVFTNGYKKALSKVINEENNDIYIEDISYAIVLFETRYPADNFVKDVVYTNYPSVWLQVDYFGKYHFIIDKDNLDMNGVYVYRKGNEIKNILMNEGFSFEEIEEFEIAKK